MPSSIRAFAIVSRAEFLLPNLGSLIMGLAWGASPPLGLINALVLIVVSFSVINLSSAIGAQVNTLSDYTLDLKDERKKELVEALGFFGHRRLKAVILVELVLTLALVSLFTMMQGKPILLAMWVVGISLGYAYSAPPLRLKSRSWVAPISLILVLGVFPLLFAYYAFTFDISLFFLMSVSGLALTIYGVIVPTEIRDYFGDKAMKIETMTVMLGLSRASILSMVLLASGSVLAGTALLLEWLSSGRYWLTPILVAIPAVVAYVLRQLRKLQIQSERYESSEGETQISLGRSIVELSAQNPRWIMMVTQTYSLLSATLLASKFLL